MFAPLGFTYGGDILPGEAMFVDHTGRISRKRLKCDTLTPCVFEYVYFARPDSVLNQVSVYRARQRMGKNLAKRWQERHPTVHPDVVVPVPFSSNPIALAMALELGIPYSEGLYKNSFIGRTFIMPGLEVRKRAVKRKLSPQPIELRDRDVLVVDDSIVRGITSREVVDMVRTAGAKKVYFASACPPIKYPDYYGIDIPTADELIASHKSSAFSY
jgi:amidophosphoribosyltransferase